MHVLGTVKANGGRWQNKDTVYPCLSRPVTTSTQPERSEDDAWLWPALKQKKNTEWGKDCMLRHRHQTERDFLKMYHLDPVTIYELCTDLLLFKTHLVLLKRICTQHVQKKSINNSKMNKQGWIQKRAECHTPSQFSLKGSRNVKNRSYGLFVKTNSHQCYCDFHTHSVWQARSDLQNLLEHKKKTCTHTTNFNLRWPAPVMINDLHPWFQGGRTVSESVRPPPQVAEEREEERRKMRRRRWAICCSMSLYSSLRFLLCGRQAVWGCGLDLLSFQYVYVITSLCLHGEYVSMC